MSGILQRRHSAPKESLMLSLYMLHYILQTVSPFLQKERDGGGKKDIGMLRKRETEHGMPFSVCYPFPDIRTFPSASCLTHYLKPLCETDQPSWVKLRDCSETVKGGMDSGVPR